MPRCIGKKAWSRDRWQTWLPQLSLVSVRLWSLFLESDAIFSLQVSRHDIWASGAPSLPFRELWLAYYFMTDI